MAAVDSKDVAQRAIDDPEYAWEVLQSSEHVGVRDALMQDIRDSGEVSGYLNPQPLPPRIVSYEVWRSQIVPRWPGIDFAATRGIIVVGG
jgi:hypothetical protein